MIGLDRYGKRKREAIPLPHPWFCYMRPWTNRPGFQSEASRVRVEVISMSPNKESARGGIRNTVRETPRRPSIIRQGNMISR